MGYISSSLVNSGKQGQGQGRHSGCSFLKPEGAPFNYYKSGLLQKGGI